MPELLLLVGDPTKARNDNHTRIERGFGEAGWRVCTADHDAVEITGNRLRLDGRAPEEFDLIWPLGFGHAATFLDRMQMLDTLPPNRFVTAPQAMVVLHGKHRWLHLMPETHTSTRVDRIHDIIAAGGDWVVKPTAGSYGRDVTVFRNGSVERQALERLSESTGGGYLLAQRYLPEIENGEKRTLIAAGRRIGTYLRLPEADGRANLAAGGRAAPGELTDAEIELIDPLALELRELGIGFAAIDTVGGHLMEVNVANPGGLQTLEALYGEDLTGAVVRAILEWRAPQTTS